MQSLSTNFHHPPKNYIIKNRILNNVKNLCRNSNDQKKHSENSSRIRGDVIIVGGGVAGSALACTFGKAGRQVHLIERNLSEPNKMVGEILQPAGYLKLLELGLEDCVCEIDAQRVLGYAIYKDGKSIKLPFPLEKYDVNVAGRSFHHGRFVQKLRRKAASLLNVELEQGTVTSLVEENGEIKGVRYKTSVGREMTAYAPLTIVCDGCFSNFRKLLAKPKISKPSHFVCLTVENCEVPHRNYGNAIMGNPSTIVFYAISSSEVRFIIDITGPKLPSISDGQMATFLKTVVAPQVPPEMCSAFLSAVDKGGIRTMPVSCMPAAPLLTPGAILLGDALNMRHAITGGGMTVALQDVALLCNLFSHVNLGDTATVMKYTKHFYNLRKPMAFMMNVMADSLHKVMCASPDEWRPELQRAFFNYLSLGDIFVRGQSKLISGLSTKPWSLVLNLLAIAIYIVGSMLFPIPSPKRVYAAAQVALVTAAGVMPMILDEGLRQVFFTTKAPK